MTGAETEVGFAFVETAEDERRIQPPTQLASSLWKQCTIQHETQPAMRLSVLSDEQRVVEGRTESRLWPEVPQSQAPAGHSASRPEDDQLRRLLLVRDDDLGDGRRLAANGRRFLMHEVHAGAQLADVVRAGAEGHHYPAADIEQRG